MGSGKIITDKKGNIYEYYLNLPFGETMMQQQTNRYYKNHYKFTGKELDERTGLYDFGARHYNPSWGVWLSVDPLASDAPCWTPYRFGFNNPLKYIDSDGQFELPVAQAKKYQRLAHYLKNGIQAIANNKTILGALKKYGQFTDKQIKSALEWGKGPSINVTNLDGANGAFSSYRQSKRITD